MWLCGFRWEEIEGNRELTPTGVEMLVEDDNGYIRGKTSCEMPTLQALDVHVSAAELAGRCPRAGPFSCCMQKSTAAYFLDNPIAFSILKAAVGTVSLVGVFRV